MDQMRKAFAAIRLLGSYSLGLLDHRHVLIRFTIEDNFHLYWLRGYWMIQEFPMSDFKWSMGFRLDVELSLAPVSISFEALPIQFFDKSALFTIANAIGVPLKID